MANPLVDMITHPGNEDEFPLDLDAIVAAAVRHNVILELNDHSFDPHSSRVDLDARASASSRRRRSRPGAPVAIGSDAHYALHVGRFDAALAVAEELGLRRGAHREPLAPSRCSPICSASGSGRGSTSAASGTGPSRAAPRTERARW